MSDTQLAIAYMVYALVQAILLIRWKDIDKSTFLVLLAAMLAPVVTLALLCDFVNWIIGVAVGRDK